MIRDHLPALSIGIRYCIDTTGKVTYRSITQPSGVADFDRDVAQAIAASRYQPYLADGVATAACTNFTMKHEVSRAR